MKKEKRNLLDWFKNLVRNSAPDMDSVPEPPDDQVVSTLMSRALYAGDDGKADEPNKNKEEKEVEIEDKKSLPEDVDLSEMEAGERKTCCPFAVRRNIVLSLEEIRRFAEEHHLAENVIRALLTILAELAIGAMRGKVSSKALDILLKVFNYETALADAYARGEKDGRNAGIEEEYFPKESDGLPHLRGIPGHNPQLPDIFTLATQA
ncbi:MAG: hypothetical protein K2J82_07905 [Muribaculaceae bacterium]|nr:hypothetical protein [Muribaculaceae bacterium]MDE6754520.1 hypothetical protein [Muribaculaceae bacterium]